MLARTVISVLGAYIGVITGNAIVLIFRDSSVLLHEWQMAMALSTMQFIQGILVVLVFYFLVLRRSIIVFFAIGLLWALMLNSALLGERGLTILVRATGSHVASALLSVLAAIIVCELFRLILMPGKKRNDAHNQSGNV